MGLWRRVGGQCPKLTTASARSVCVSLSAFFFVFVFLHFLPDPEKSRIWKLVMAKNPGFCQLWSQKTSHPSDISVRRFPLSWSWNGIYIPDQWVTEFCFITESEPCVDNLFIMKINQELLVVRDKVGRPPGELGVSNVIFFPSVFWHCWLGDRKDILHQVMGDNAMRLPLRGRRCSRLDWRGQQPVKKLSDWEKKKNRNGLSHLTVYHTWHSSYD